MKIIKLFILFISLVSCNAQSDNGLYAKIDTNKGEIVLKLHYKKVPLTVANFVALAEGNHPKVKADLANKPYYEGIIFHRVIKDFMIQSGDPTGTGRGGAGYSFADEFPKDDKGNLVYKHDKAGILSMANSGPATNSSQFFITHKDTPWLDGRHTVFGEVVKGQDVVNKIQKGDTMKKVSIIRVGKEAKKFDAPKSFLEETKKIKEKEEKEKAELKKLEKVFKEKMGIKKSKKTKSGLQYLELNKGTGTKVDLNKPCTVHYTLYNSVGKKIDSSLDRNQPFTFTANKVKLIPGWVEGVKMMRVGDKSRLFIPSHLGYGKAGRAPIIAPNTDLIFELEILKVGN